MKANSVPAILLAGILTAVLHVPASRRADAADTAQAESAAAVKVIPGDKAREDPFLGDWQGRWAKGWPQNLVAQVIPRGQAKYTIRFLPAFDHRCPAFAVVSAKSDGSSLRFDEQGWSGQIKPDGFTGTGRFRGKPTAFTLEKAERLSPHLGAKPPAEATVLFDGGDLDKWESDGRGGVKDIPWKRIDDFVRVWPPLEEHSFGAAMRTRRAFPAFHLHLEFRLPLLAAAQGQTRANSGVIIEEFEFYEVQILDSYGLPGYWDECGAIYNKEAPKVNMCAPPGQWQSYDITYHGPKFDDDGNLVAKPRITVDHNGRRIHTDVELPCSEGALKRRREKPEAKTPGRITLQHHGDPVDFRNIWIKELPTDE